MAKIFSLDSFRNLVSNLGTTRDKASSGEYAAPSVTDEDLLNAYRGAWLPRKIVDIPALDATRKWRSWQAEATDISAIEAEEKRLGLKLKTKDALTKARLYGGSGIYIGIRGDRDPSLPLDPSRVQRNGLEFLTVLPKRVLQAGPIDNDPVSPGYGKPTHYTISSKSGADRIHPSRIARFLGAPYPDDEFSGTATFGWGDSILTALFTACRNTDATLANIASLIYEAKVDVLGIPNLAEYMSNPEDRAKLVERATLSAMIKGNNGMLIRDSEESYDTKSFNFGNLDNIANLFLQVNSGAADIPMTRLFGQSASGLNSTGESDLRNYYDRVQSSQELEMTPALDILDECLIRSALGDRPDSVHYVWSSLWQTSETERSEIGERAANTINSLSDTMLFPEEALSKAAMNMLVELSVLPGLEQAIQEYGEEFPEREEGPDADT